MKGPRSTDEAIRIIERFDSLPVENRLDIFRKLSPQAREELIEIVSRPGEIVRRISEEEMFFTIKELGEENAPYLVRATTGRQLNYVLDTDLWKKDVFDKNAARRWLELITRISRDKTLHLVQAVDPELLITALNPFVRIEIRRSDIDLVEQRDSLPAFSLDEVFFVEFLDPDCEDFVRPLLESLFGWNPEYYVGLMEELAHGIHLENEELALKWRQGRMADHGVPSLDEAMEVYQYFQSIEFSGSTFDSNAAHEGESPEPGRLLEYPMRFADGSTLLSKCLSTIDDPSEKHRFSMDLARLANKVMVADGKDPGSIEEMHGARAKVSGYVNMALEETCTDSVADALKLLGSTHMELLFRRGFSLILDLRKQAHKLLRNYEGGLENLGYPLPELIKGLLRNRPIYAGNVMGEEGPREFKSLEDVRAITELMGEKALEDRWEPI